MPARIYGRPLELYIGRELSLRQLRQELNLLHYIETERPKKSGEYSIVGNTVTIFSREIRFSNDRQEAAVIKVSFQDTHVSSLTSAGGVKQLSLFRLEPLLIASIYPNDNEDRLLVRLEDTPPLLGETLLLIEDREFYRHFGLRPSAILRALVANIKAGRTVQGGSTLTQQLVKNFFLTSEKNIQRKVNEALMSLLLEYHYQKDEILEAYLNEIYLGQDGGRAIHGFAKASRFYFQRNIDELAPEQIALLVGIAKGASFYNPRKHPDRAKLRRDMILGKMAQAGLVPLEEIDILKEKSLGVSKRIPSGLTPYPAFVQLVRNQLKRDYRNEDLQSEGLSIFTTFDPIYQEQAEKSIQKILTKIEKERNLPEATLQGAFVLSSVDQGEVLAVVGDRFSGKDGFNRALDMERPVGSVIKPAIYLNALNIPDTYNLLTLLNDTPLSISLVGEDWQPQNYDKKFHGSVPLIQALVDSLNVASVQLGMELGLDSVIDTLHQLGIEKTMQAYPSLLLGAVELPPVSVLQMYQSIAAGGYKTPLRTILAVTDRKNKLLQRYPLTVEQVAEPAAVFCLNTALQEVTRRGTGRRIQQLLPPGVSVAGKTGTTNELRDSWFAGFSASHVAVAWVGRDDNKSTGLTGSTGAMRIWAEIMKEIKTTSLDLRPPENIDFYHSDIQTGQLFSDQCQQGELLPFVRGGVLPPVIACESSKQNRSGETQQNKSVKQTLREGVQKFLRIFQ